MATLQQAADAHALDRMRDPAWARRIARAAEQRHDPGLAALIDVFGQPARGWTPGEYAALARLLDLGEVERLAYAIFDVGREPGPDCDRAGNQAALAGLAAQGLNVVVDQDQHWGDSDGRVTWDRPLAATTGRTPVEIFADLPPMAQLEIGYTCVTTTLRHLTDVCAVARWPYGSRKLVIVTTIPCGLLADDVARLLAETPLTDDEPEEQRS